MPIVLKAVTEDEYYEWVEEMLVAQTDSSAGADRDWSMDELMERGAQVYGTFCVACHQANGQGLPPAFPALAGGAITTGPVAGHIDRVFNGKAGTAMAAFGPQLGDVDLDTAALDLIAQAEHDPQARTFFITPDPDLVDRVAKALDEELEQAGRREIVDAALQYTKAVLVRDLDQAAEVANDLASEHLLLLLDDPHAFLPLVRNAGAIFLPLGLNMVIFALLFHYVPARRVYWDAVWPAALFGGVGWELAKQAFSWYLTNFANFDLVYSTIATVIVLLLWAFLLASIFLFSAELCAQLNDWFLFQHEAEWAELEAEEAPAQLPPEMPVNK